MKRRYYLVLFLLVLSAAIACHAQNRPGRITTIEDATGQSQRLQTRQTYAGHPQARQEDENAEDEKPPRAAVKEVEISLKNIDISMVEEHRTNGAVVVTSAVLRVSFDAAFRTSKARCTQPFFATRWQLQHADTTRSRIGFGRVVPYCTTFPTAAVDSSTIPKTSKVTLDMPAFAGDKILYLAIQANGDTLWQRGRALGDDEPTGKPRR